jgi:hypothetical protein
LFLLNEDTVILKIETFNSEVKPMKNSNFSNVTGDGTLYTNGAVGLISRSQFLDEELPEGAIVYLLHHPKRKKHTWILENLQDVVEIPQPRETFGFSSDEPPEVAFVCFCTEPEFDYLTFGSEDPDTYIKWWSGHTMQDIINQTLTEEEE